MYKKLKEQKAITLVALIITVIILLILASVTIAFLPGDEGIVGKVRWAAYLNEYETVNEKKEVYANNKRIEQMKNSQLTIKDELKVASTNTPIVSSENNETVYPVGQKITIDTIAETLRDAIMQYEGVNEDSINNINKVNLYELDLDKIDVKAKHQYAINIVSGVLYNIDVESFNKKIYHNPKVSVQVNTKLSELGKYEMIIDVGEEQLANWETVDLVYNKYIENSVICKVFISEDGIEWKEQSIEKGEKNNNIEKYNVLTELKTRYLKAEIEITDVSGQHSEIEYVLVNFYKFRNIDVMANITVNGVEKVGDVYTLPANSASTATGTVTQTIQIPDEEGEYAINLERYGNPSTTVTIVTSSGTQTVTLEELKSMTLHRNATVTISTTLAVGDTIEEATVMKKENTISSKRRNPKISIENDETGEWKTVKKSKYMYNNGGSGYWQQCLIDSKEVNTEGMLEVSNTKRIQVTYQTSANGSKWTEEFSNIADADNIQYLKVNVYYQTLGGVEYGNTNSKVLVKLMEGSWKANFYDDNGNRISSRRVYFTNAQSEATFTLPVLTKNGFLLESWHINENEYMPGTSYTLRSDTDFTASYIKQGIETEKDFEDFRDTVNKGNSFEGQTVMLSANLDLSKYCSSTTGNWTPIGTTSNPFKGTFDGNNCTISNLYIKNSNNSYCGFFGSISNATIKNVKIEGAIEAKEHCGLIAGYAKSSKIENVDTLVNSSVKGTYYLGGLIGQATSTTVTSCSNKATVDGTQWVGGISGLEGTITKSYNTANITSTRGYAGGIVGTNGSITYSYNTGNISGYGDDGTGYTSVGGIAGAGTVVRYSYNKGTIYGSKGQVAGIVGNIYGMGGTPISYCYNIGACTGSGRAIGSIGGECNSSTISYCVFTTSNPTNGYRGSNNNCSRLSDDQMKAYTNDYFFTDTKNINGGYPILEWQK